MAIGGAARRLAGLLCLVVVVAGGAYGYWVLVEHRLAVVTRGKVYRSGAMPHAHLLAVVRRYGIRAVVDLREPGGGSVEEGRVLARAGVRHFHIPSPQVPPYWLVDRFLEVVGRAENQPVLIHCTHGVGRAVLYAALYRIEYEGWSNERARETAYWRSGLGNFKIGSRKGDFLRAYRPRSRRRGAAAETHPPR